MGGFTYSLVCDKFPVRQGSVRQWLKSVRDKVAMNTTILREAGVV